MNEIKRLCEITPPDVAVVLNVLPVHVEHLGTIENVANAKAELIQGMKPGGVAVLNADDRRVAAMADISRGSVVTFGIESTASLMATNIVFDELGTGTFELLWEGARVPIAFPLNGLHNIYNALAAAAVGLVFGIGLKEIARSLESIEPPPQRGVVHRFREGFTVIDDSYNSNPAALMSMVNILLSTCKNTTRSVVVAGEMLELGPDESRVHREIGGNIASSGVDMLIGVRGLAEDMVKGARSAGMAEARFVEDSEAAATLIANIIRKGDLVLVKGSRGVKTERVIGRLLEIYELEGKA
jgi:UDP-N-acetylmuramoyl-tripeptide--D-alanyl-D-alanine ligase